MPCRNLLDTASVWAACSEGEKGFPESLHSISLTNNNNKKIERRVIKDLSGHLQTNPPLKAVSFQTQKPLQWSKADFSVGQSTASLLIFTPRPGTCGSP